MIILLAFISVLVGGFMIWYLERCLHSWKPIHEGEIVNPTHKDIIIGWVKVYQCEHCKKMKKEQIMIND